MVHSENSHFLMHKLFHDSMSKLYASQAILTFVKSLIGIFVPIYLFSLGFPLVNVLMYLIGTSVAFLFIIPIAVKIINRIGFKWTILATIPIYVLHILSLNYIQTEAWMFHVAWISFGFYNGIFWPAFHSEIAINGHKEKRGSEIGTLQVLSILAATMAPLVGGFVLEFFNYTSLLIVSIVLLGLSTLPLLVSEDIKLHNYNFRYRDYFKFVKGDKYRTSKKAFMFEGIENALAIGIWPIILYLILSQNFFSLGILFTIISLISVVFITFIKKYVDKHDRRTVLKAVTKFESAGWFFRSILIIVGSFLVYIVESLSKLIIDVVRLTYISIFYNNASSSKSYLDYIIMREFYLHCSRTAFILFMVAVLLYFGNVSPLTLSLLVLFGMVGALGMSYLREES